MSQFDVTWERVRLEVERLRVSSGPSGYDPRLELAMHYAQRGEYVRSSEEVQRIERDNPAAGYIGWEALKRLHLDNDRTFWAQHAANGAAGALKKLNRG